MRDPDAPHRPTGSTSGKPSAQDDSATGTDAISARFILTGQMKMGYTQTHIQTERANTQD